MYKLTKKLNVNILFWVRVKTVICRVTINGQRCNFSTGVECQKKDWNAKKNRTNNQQDNAKLSEIEASLIDRHNELLILQKDNPHTAKQLVDDVWYKKASSCTCMRTLIDEYVRYCESRIGTDLELSTFKAYRSKLNNVKDFISYSKNKYALIQTWNNGVSMDLEAYIKGIRKSSHNHVCKVLDVTRQVFNYAYEKKYTNTLLFTAKRTKLPTKIIALSLEEVEQFEKTDVAKFSKYIQRAKDAFLLQCYTGLAFTELNRISRKNLHSYTNLEWQDWIIIDRKKTTKRKLKPCVIPLLPKAKQILEKYNYSIPSFHNNFKYNNGIRTILALANITKDIKSHNGRKTFGNILFELGVSMESISRMYGHEHTQQTEQSYVKISQDKIAKEICFAMNKPTKSLYRNTM